MQRLKFTLKGKRVWGFIAWIENSELKISKMQGLRKLEINQVLMKMGDDSFGYADNVMSCGAVLSHEKARRRFIKLAWSHF